MEHTHNKKFTLLHASMDEQNMSPHIYMSSGVNTSMGNHVAAYFRAHHELIRAYGLNMRSQIVASMASIMCLRGRG